VADFDARDGSEPIGLFCTLRWSGQPDPKGKGLHMLAYSRGIGLISLLLAVAAMLALPDYFVWFVVLIYAVIVIWALDLFFEVPTGRLARGGVIIATLAALGWFTFAFVLAKIPVVLMASSRDVTYAPGTKLGGIYWIPEYSEMRTVIGNETDNDYSDIDLAILPDEPIAEIDQISNVPNVSVSPLTPFLENPQLQTTSGVGLPMNLIASTGGYRLRCDELPSHASIELVVAIGNIDMSRDHAFPYVIRIGMKDGTAYWFQTHDPPNPEMLWEPRHPPKMLQIKGTYVARHRKVTISKRLDISDMVRPIIEQAGPK
jgi:hypothetical protein